MCTVKVAAKHVITGLVRKSQEKKTQVQVAHENEVLPQLLPTPAGLGAWQLSCSSQGSLALGVLQVYNLLSSIAEITTEGSLLL